MQKALLFMPDISGFTEFIQQTEIQHSKHIIKELLELLLDQNRIGLELVEIEGDALFFYKIDEQLTPELLADQVKQMYEAFHHHLQLYKYRRICNCGACTNAEGLKLKFIVHDAFIDFIEVRDTRKPFGEDVIKVHRLLKNNIPTNEYLLVTAEYLNGKSDAMQALFNNSEQRLEEQYDTETCVYFYYSLDHFEQKPVIDRHHPKPELGRHILSSEINLSVKANDVFQFVLDFDKRHLWSEGVDEIKYEEGEINRVGSKHTCVIGGSNLNLSTVYKDEDDQELIFVESTDDAPILKNISTVFTVAPTTSGSMLNIDVYTTSTSFLGRILTPILKRKLSSSQKKSVEKLKEILESSY